jgi:guanylate kinase
MQGKMVIVSAPSGAGKTTIVKHITDRIPSLGFSVSATSRLPRTGETDGADYYFLSSDEFRIKIDNNEFVEWEEVYPGQFYGTLMSEVERMWGLNRHIIFDVDVKGGINLKNRFGDVAISVFIMPPSIEELKKRLLLRGKDSHDKIDMRVGKSADEIGYSIDFDAIIINDNLEKAQDEAYNIISRFLNQK